MTLEVVDDTKNIRHNIYFAYFLYVDDTKNIRHNIYFAYFLYVNIMLSMLQLNMTHTHIL